MGGICVEARPHPDFVGKGWWRDMDCILSQARRRGMKVWILDDSHFPTGFANGKIKTDFPQYRKVYAACRRYDIQGPLPGARIDFALLKGRPWEKSDFSEKVLGVYLARRTAEPEDWEPPRHAAEPWRTADPIDAATLTDISAGLTLPGRELTVDVPAGAYSIFVVFQTGKGGEDATKDYLNPLVAAATQVLVDEVYEPHWQHYRADFGATIEGFFSDEPRFGNMKGTDCTIGRPDMPLPWRDGMEAELPFDRTLLPLLWTPAGGAERAVRTAYMDFVTGEYHRNFTGVLAAWCNSHGVLYLGHNIEDNGAHARLGYGTGHYFRGQEEMDMAGVDVIGGQIVPGMNYHHDAFSTGGSNGEFYHYALAKLASSAAHLDPKKQGRALCEAFGAYGWNEGLKTMKWIADHLIVRGINYLVPHAFNPAPFPDADCPPHFYAHGHNPQFRYYPQFSAYVNRLCTLCRGGRYPAEVALLYPAELEWAGAAMPVEKPARALTRAQIAFDIVTQDWLLAAALTEGGFTVHETTFRALVVPFGEALSAPLVHRLCALHRQGVAVLFAGAQPKQCFAGDAGTEAEFRTLLADCPAVPLSSVAASLAPWRHVLFAGEEPDVAVGEYEKDGTRYYLFFNESTSRTVDAAVSLPRETAGRLWVYDAATDTSTLLPAERRLHLAPYEATVWVAGEVKAGASGAPEPEPPAST